MSSDIQVTAFADLEEPSCRGHNPLESKDKNNPQNAKVPNGTEEQSSPASQSEVVVKGSVKEIEVKPFDPKENGLTQKHIEEKTSRESASPIMRVGVAETNGRHHFANGRKDCKKHDKFCKVTECLSECHANPVLAKRLTLSKAVSLQGLDSSVERTGEDCPIDFMEAAERKFKAKMEMEHMKAEEIQKEKRAGTNGKLRKTMSVQGPTGGIVFLSPCICPR